MESSIEVPQKLKNRTTVEPVPRSGRGRDGEGRAHRDEERPPHRDEEWPPLAATRESPRTKTKRPNTAKNK